MNEDLNEDPVLGGSEAWLGKELWKISSNSRAAFGVHSAPSQLETLKDKFGGESRG